MPEEENSISRPPLRKCEYAVLWKRNLWQVLQEMQFSHGRTVLNKNNQLSEKRA